MQITLDIKQGIIAVMGSIVTITLPDQPDQVAIPVVVTDAINRETRHLIAKRDKKQRIKVNII